MRPIDTIDNEQALRGGASPDGRGYLEGRDPRTMSQKELRGMGHEPMSPMAAIRAHCLDCCAGSSDEVRKCMALRCPSWPFRTGKNPWRAPISEERREALRQRSPFSPKPHKTEERSAGAPSQVAEAGSAR
jgi:hypothetical protein